MGTAIEGKVQRTPNTTDGVPLSPDGWCTALALAQLILASPTFTGTPAAPTNGTASDSSTQLATDAFVQNAIAAAVPSPLTVPKGGTGLTTATAHGVVLGEGASALAVTAAGGANLPLVGGGASADPTFVALTVPGGGTGLTTATAHGVLLGEGASAVAATAAGTAGQPFISGGASADGAYGDQWTLNNALATQTGAGLVYNFTYASAVTIGSPVYVNASGNVAPANATDGTKPCIGIALATASSGVHGVLLNGVVYRDDTNLSFGTVGGMVYNSATVGTFTQTAPTGSGNAIQPVGVALATHIILFIPSLSMITHT